MSWYSLCNALQACEWCEGPDASKDLLQAWQLVDEFALAEADRVFLKLLLQLEKKQADERLMSGDEVQGFVLNFLLTQVLHSQDLHCSLRTAAHLLNLTP